MLMRRICRNNKIHPVKPKLLFHGTGNKYVPHVNGVKCSAVNSNLHMHIIQHPEPFVNEKHIYVPY